MNIITSKTNLLIEIMISNIFSKRIFDKTRVRNPAILYISIDVDLLSVSTAAEEVYVKIILQGVRKIMPDSKVREHFLNSIC